MSDKKSRILIIDDHPLVRHGLEELIENEADLEVCGQAATVKEAMSLIQKVDADLAIVDLSLKDGNGLELIKQFRALDDTLKMLVFSMRDENLFAERAFDAGAQGYINKQEAMDEVVRAIKLILLGKVYVSPSMTDQMMNRMVKHKAKPERSPISTLSDRELEIFELVGDGLNTRKIAEHLHLSVKTVETHYSRIKIKLNIESYHELFRKAVQWTLE